MQLNFTACWKPCFVLFILEQVSIVRIFCLYKNEVPFIFLSQDYLLPEKASCQERKSLFFSTKLCMITNEREINK